jgi:hypothetical protein
MVFLKSLKFIICLLFMIWKPLLLFNKFSQMFHILITLCKCQIVKLGAIEIAKTLSTSTIKYCMTFHWNVNKSNPSFVTSKTHLKVNLHWPNLLSKTQATIDKVSSHWLNGQINPISCDSVQEAKERTPRYSAEMTVCNTLRVAKLNVVAPLRRITWADFRTCLQRLDKALQCQTH